MALVDLYAVRDENGNASISDALLIVGDGTVSIQFKGGHATAEADVARLVSHRTDLNIPALDHLPAPAGEARGPEVPSVEFGPSGVGASESAQAQATVQDALARKEAVELAKAHLETEGEHVPEPQEDDAVTVPEGFSYRTEDGELRCLARKGDGEQCSNTAVEGHACGLERHKALVAELQG